MARQVLPWVGAIVGNFIVPGAGASWGFAIGSMVGAAVDPMVIRGPEIGEGQAQSSTEGVPYNRIYGTACVSGNVMATGPIRKWIKKTSQGKGGPKTEEERMSMTFAIGIACHDIGGILRIWEDDKLVFDARKEGAQISARENTVYSNGFRLFKGTADQEPSADLEAIFGVGDTPSYHRRAYIVFPDRDLTERRGSIPNFRFEITQAPETVYPHDRIPCVSGYGSQGQSTASRSSGDISLAYMRESITPISTFQDSRIVRVRNGITISNSNQYLSTQPLFPGLRAPFRTLLKVGEKVIYSSGVLCSSDQVTDVNTAMSMLGISDKVVPFNITNETQTYYVYDEVKLDDYYAEVMLYFQAIVYDPEIRNVQATIYRSFNTEKPSTSHYNRETTIAHPEYPAALLDTETGDTIWVCWAEEKYDIRGTGAPIELGTLIRDVADYCEPGLDLKMDTTELAGKMVDGFVIGQQYHAKNVISNLQQTHFFDPSEYDGKINFVVRGKPVMHLITENDLIDEDPYTQLRRSSIEYPQKLHLIYQNPISDYDTAMAPATRSSPSVYSSTEKSINVPEVMKAEKAYQIADIQLKIAWAEASGNFTFSVPASWYDHWVPSDIIALYLKDTPYRLRIEKMERADGELKIEAAFDRQSAYNSRATGMPDRVPTPPPPRLAGRMIQQYLNIPALIDSNDVLGYYMGTAGVTAAYEGGVVERRIDGLDEDFVQILQVPPGKTMAALMDPILPSSEHYRDTTNVLNVALFGLDTEVLQTVTDQVFLRENNALALVDTATNQAEIVQFRDAEYLGDGKYRLSHLLRGRLNTTPRAFPKDSLVVWLEDVDLVMVDAANIGVTFEHRATAFSEQPQDSETTLDSFANPQMQTEFPVDLLRYELDGTDATVSWSPRERFGTDIAPVRSVNWEGYQITYSDGSTTETFTTLEPEHVKDLSSYTLPVTVAVAQLNRYTGAGPTQTIEIT